MDDTAAEFQSNRLDQAELQTYEIKIPPVEVQKSEDFCPL